MKVYGACLTDIWHGDMQSALVDRADCDDLEALRHRLRWDFVCTSFSDAKAKLLQEMQEDEITDPALYKSVKSCKARDIPIEQDIRGVSQ